MKQRQIKEYKILLLNAQQTNLDLLEKVFSSLDFKIKIIHATTSSEGKSLLKYNRDISIALFCCINDLELIHYIRNELLNAMVRIVFIGFDDTIITLNAVNSYDINAVHTCKNLSQNSIYATLRSALVQYEQRAKLAGKEIDSYKKMTRDSLTNLYNRVKLNEECMSNATSTLILIDIIGFSKINENYGYEVGDSVLSEFGAFLFTLYHDDFKVFHLENDLFGLMPRVNAVDKIFKTVKAIRSDILKLKIITNNFNNRVDISIGVAYESHENILRKAELALKEARNSGINKIKYYSKDLKVLKQIDNTSFWAPIIQENIMNDSLLVYFQPIYNLRTYTIDKYELLMRMKHENKIYLPGSFIDAAYQAGLMYDIFKFMFTKACQKVQKRALKFSVNIGNQELEKEELFEFVSETIKRYEVDATKLSLEILEYNSVSNNRVIKENLLKIHTLGVAIIIDDFGVNCSNFGQLQDLPVSIIKIDGSFIANIDSSKESQTVVKTIQTYAKEKNIKLVAEYIANKEVLRTVLGLNIEYGQGNYLYAAQEKISEV